MSSNLGKGLVVNQDNLQKPLCRDLRTNAVKMKEVFVADINKDFVGRVIHIKSIDRDAVLLFLLGMVDQTIIQKDILTPLLTETISGVGNEDIGTALMKRIITCKNLRKVKTYREVTDEVLMGNSVLLIQGYSEAITIATTSYEHRAVEKPTSENTLKGPKEAFVESDQVNSSLIRKALRNEKLVTESIMIGERGI